MAAFVRLSPSGRSFCYQEPGDPNRIGVDGELVAIGISPAWLSDDEVAFADGGSTVKAYSLATQQTRIIRDTGRPINHFTANGRGQWVAWHASTPFGFTTDLGEFTASLIRPTLSPNGTLLFPPNGAIELRCTDGGFSFIQHPAPPRCRPAGWFTGGWDPVTHWAVPVWTPAGPWILRLEDTRLVLHPEGSSLGYVVSTGHTDWPDAIWAGDGIRVAWTGLRGVLVSVTIPMTQPRLDLRVIQAIPPPVTPPVPPIPPPVPPMANLDPKTFSWRHVTIIRDASDVGSWPMTSTVVSAGIEGDKVVFEHTRTGTWPPVTYGTIQVEGALWVIADTPQGIRAETFDRLRVGQTEKEMNPNDYGAGYALNVPGWNPQRGQIVGLMASTPARNQERGPRNERSQVAFVEFGTGRVVGFEGEPYKPPTPPTPVPEPPVPQPPPVTPPDVLKSLEGLHSGQDAMLKALTAMVTFLADNVEGRLVTLEDQVEVVHQQAKVVQDDLHTLVRGLQTQVAELSLPVDATVKLPVLGTGRVTGKIGK